MSKEKQTIEILSEMEWKRIVRRDIKSKINLSDRWYQLILSMIRKVGLDLSEQGIKILEVGCGLGGFCLWASKKCENVVGLDIGRARLHQGNSLRKRLKRKTSFIVGDAQSLPFKSELYDIVVCSETLEHIPNYKKAFNELVRVTKKFGHIILTFPNYINMTLLYKPISFLLSSTPKKWNSQPPDLHSFNIFTINRLFEREDLKVLVKEGIGLIHLPSAKPKIRFIDFRLNKPVKKLKFLCINIGVIAQKIKNSR